MFFLMLLSLQVILLSQLKQRFLHEMDSFICIHILLASDTQNLASFSSQSFSLGSKSFFRLKIWNHGLSR